MIRLLIRIFRRPVVVKTYKRENSDLAHIRREKHKQLARELGLPEVEWRV